MALQCVSIYSAITIQFHLGARYLHQTVALSSNSGTSRLSLSVGQDKTNVVDSNTGTTSETGRKASVARFSSKCEGNYYSSYCWSTDIYP